MKILKEKFLLLEEEDPQDLQSDEVASNPEDELDLTEDPSEFADPELSSTVWKVTFNLGKNSNWSRYEAKTEEEAKQAVENYITSKWPDREYEFVSIEKFDETNESLNENLNEYMKDMSGYRGKFYNYFSFLQNENKIDNICYLAGELIRYCQEEDLKDLWLDRMGKTAEMVGFEDTNGSLKESLTDANPIETGAEVGMASVISDLIKDEYEAIDGYNSAIATAEAEGFEDMINVLTEIQAEENLHIGQLQAVMKTLDPNAHLISDGEQEGLEQLANPLGDTTAEEPLKEDLDDMSLQDQRMFIRCVNEIWNMSVIEWTQKYYAGQLEVTTVNSYDDIPDTSNLIEIDSSDLSQGTGNVIIYTYMNAGDGSLYRYADY